MVIWIKLDVHFIYSFEFFQDKFFYHTKGDFMETPLKIKIWTPLDPPKTGSKRSRPKSYISLESPQAALQTPYPRSSGWTTYLFTISYLKGRFPSGVTKGESRGRQRVNLPSNSPFHWREKRITKGRKYWTFLLRTLFFSKNTFFPNSSLVWKSFWHRFNWFYVHFTFD